MIPRISLLAVTGAAIACGAATDIDKNNDFIADDLGTPVDQNGDGVINGADQIDWDSDGVPDGVGIDRNGDGVADGYAFDGDGDGILETFTDGVTMIGGSGGMSGSGGSGQVGVGGAGSGPAAGGSGAGPATGGSAGGLNTGGGGPTAECGITISASEPAMAMPTVGMIGFSTDVAAPTSVTVEFGLDTNYGMVAPAEEAAGGYTAMLLGMKKSSEYHYRVAVTGPSGTCYSDDQTLMTGGLRSGVPEPTQSMAGGAPGFIITATNTQVIIIDKDGDVVWGYNIQGAGMGFIGVTSGHMSWDGKYMYARDLGPFDAGTGGTMWRIAMDGSGDEQINLTGGHHHEFTVIPDGIAYLAKAQQGQCDNIYTANADGSGAAPLMNLAEIFDFYPPSGGTFGTEECHANYIHYMPDTDQFSVSDREKDALGLIDASTGAAVRSIGKAPQGSPSFDAITAEGGGTDWRVQHGHHWYADDKVVVFSNGAMGGAGAGGSKVIHYTISGSNASIDWTYAGAGNSMTMGEVEHLPNGNFLVTASEAGNIHEIDASQNLVASYKFSRLGYSQFRETLYGPPPN